VDQVAAQRKHDRHDLLAEVLVGDDAFDVGLLLVQLAPEVLEVRVAVHDGRVQHELRTPGALQLQQLHFPLAVFNQRLGAFGRIQILLDLVVVHALGLVLAPVLLPVRNDDLVPVDVRGELGLGLEPDQQQHQRREGLQDPEERRHPLVPTLEVEVGRLVHLALVAEVLEASAAVGAWFVGLVFQRATPLPADEDQNHEVLDPSDRERHVCEYFYIKRVEDTDRVFGRHQQFFVQLHFFEELRLVFEEARDLGHLILSVHGLSEFVDGHTRQIPADRQDWEVDRKQVVGDRNFDVPSVLGEEVEGLFVPQVVEVLHEHPGIVDHVDDMQHENRDVEPFFE